MDQAFLQELHGILVNAGSPSNEVQAHVLKTINSMSLRSDFGSHLALILGDSQSDSLEVRQRAGLLLKSSVTRGTVDPGDTGIRSSVLGSLVDPSSVIRKTAGSIISSMVLAARSVPCSDVLGTLLVMLNSTEPHVADGAFDALSKICEDLIQLWRQKALATPDEASDDNSVILNDFMAFSDEKLIPNLLSMSSGRNLVILNSYALNFLFFPNHPLGKFLLTYFNRLGTLAASETQPMILVQICKGLTYIAQHHPDLYSTSLPAVISFMLRSTHHRECDVRLDALQFWPVVCLNSEWIPQLEPFLPELLPVLLEHMVYTEDDYLAMDEAVLADDNAQIPDRPEEIAPRFHKEKDGDDEDEAELASTWGSEWTVRKAAASSLDHLATAYRDSILGTILPLIENRLTSNDWEIQESALLALGAIGHGCMQGLSPHLPSILQLLVSIAKSPKPLLRSISCWTISRFAQWIAFDTHRVTALPLALAVILSRMMDQNKRVQEAAVSAFVSLEEEVGMYLDEYLDDVINTLCRSLNYYQSKNLLILLDAIACLFESLGTEIMSKPGVANVIVPPIVSAFLSVSYQQEKQLTVSLFECLTSICTSVGHVLPTESIRQIITRCAVFLDENIKVRNRIVSGLDKEVKPDGDILACSLDLLCGVIDGLGTSSTGIIKDLNFIPLLCDLIMQFEPDSRVPLVRNYYSNTVKQCAFALLGDCAKNCHVLITDVLIASVLPTTIAFVTLGPMLVSNNACWALGELAMRLDNTSIYPFIDSAATALLHTLKRFDASFRPIVRQNAAIALGRLALPAADRLVTSGTFAEMFEPWCTIMRRMRTDDEKISAVRGFIMCIEKAPQLGTTPEKFQRLHELIASMIPPPSVLEQSLKNIVISYRDVLGPDWLHMWSMFPIELQYRINHAFSLGLQLDTPNQKL
jgi:transportin-1